MNGMKVKNMTANEIVAKVQDKISGRKLGDILELDLYGNELIIRFKKMGTSEFFYSVEEKEDETIFKCTKEKVAFAHKAFRGDIERKMVTVLEQIGVSVF